MLKRGAMGVVVLAVVPPSLVGAQQTAALVFDGVTVVDVDRGRLVPNHRVVIVGNRIQAVGPAEQTLSPPAAQHVPATGKYLIPGLWDMHFHTPSWSPEDGLQNAPSSHASLIIYGVTGIRDAGTNIPVDTLRVWQRAILAGTRVGPPRQLLSGDMINDTSSVASASWVHYIESLKAGGADMVKLRAISATMYFHLAAAARRIGMPFGGHIDEVSAITASDSGARIIDHGIGLWQHTGENCFGWKIPGGRAPDSAARCQTLAERLRANDTWVTTTLYAGSGSTNRPVVYGKLSDSLDREHYSTWLRAWVHDSQPVRLRAAKMGGLPMRDAQRAGLPLLAGTDPFGPPLAGQLHVELAMLVQGGLTPAEALQAATLNPAKMWHATDSLGAVAPGKLADLVLLDADPLADITNTLTIRAVVANGRYFDATVLDSVWSAVQRGQAKKP